MSKKKKQTATAPTSSDQKHHPAWQEIRNVGDDAGMVSHRLPLLAEMISCEAEAISEQHRTTDRVCVSAWAIEEVSKELDAIERSAIAMAYGVDQGNDETASALRGIAEKLDGLAGCLDFFSGRAEVESRNTTPHYAIAAAAWAVGVLANELDRMVATTRALADRLQASTVVEPAAVTR